MMEKHGIVIYVLCCLLFVISSVNCWPHSTCDTRPADCNFVGTGDHPLCQQTPCPTVGHPPSGLPGVYGVTPKLIGIKLYKDQQTPAFNLSFSLPANGALNYSSAVTVTVALKNVLGSAKCYMFNYSNALFTEEDIKNPPRLYSTCFTGFAYHAWNVYLITLSSHPSLASITYTAKIVENSIWNTTVAVASQNNVIGVAFNPAPESLNITEYNVQLQNTADFSIADFKNISRDIQSCEFRNVQPGTYFVQVRTVCESSVITSANSSVIVVDPVRILEIPKSKLSITCRSVKSSTTTQTVVTTVLDSTISSKSTVKTSKKPTSKTTGQDQPIIKPAGPTEEYAKSLKIVFGTVFGVVGMVAIVLVSICIYRRRIRATNIENGLWSYSPHRSISGEFHKKSSSVLLLYSYDCPAHEKVIQALSDFLIQICNCHVHLDVLEEQVICQKGIHSWLMDCLNEVDYVLIICSVGARIRCSRNRVVFKTDPKRTVSAEYFNSAVDYVADKMRMERLKSLDMTCLVANFEYSTGADIPPQLEIAKRFSLMKDIEALYCHLHGITYDSSKMGSSFPGVTAKTYDKCDVGAGLKSSIEEAKLFFKDYPNWVEDRLERLQPAGKYYKHHESYHDDKIPLLGQTSTADDYVNVNVVMIKDKHSEYLDGQTSSHIRKIKDNQSNSPIHNRQSSLPSTLAPGHVRSSSNGMQINTSRSCNAIHDLDKSNINSPIRSTFLLQNKSDRNTSSVQESEDVQHGKDFKSKSMPSVYTDKCVTSTSLLAADVHQDWDPEDMVVKQADRQGGGASDQDLDQELQCITIPTNFERVRYNGERQFLASTFLDTHHQSSPTLVSAYHANFIGIEGNSLQLRKDDDSASSTNSSIPETINLADVYGFANHPNC